MGAMKERKQNTQECETRKKNKAGSASHNIDENREGETLNGHLKQESLPYRMSGTEYSKSTTQRETLGKDKILFGYNKKIQRLIIKYT